MEYGVHLPQISMDGTSFTHKNLIEYVKTAEQLGYQYLCANDHLLFSRPWLDGPTALAALISHTTVTLSTTISLPVVRNPVVLAKTLGAIDLLSGGRLVVGVGAGSSKRDYEAVGIPFEERWPRFDESVRVLRTLWNPEQTFHGEYYSTENVELEPLPAQESGPPIWIGSWGSKIGLQRVAQLGDGWIASGYNTTPERFEEGLSHLEPELREAGKNPAEFPNALATMFFHVTDDEGEAIRVVSDTLSPLLNRPTDELADRLPIGSPKVCVETLAAYQAAGVRRVYLWPIKDELEQIRLFRRKVIPVVGDRS